MDQQIERYEPNRDGTGRRRRMTIDDEDLDEYSRRFQRNAPQINTNTRRNNHSNGNNNL